MCKNIILLVLVMGFAVFSQTTFMRTYGHEWYGARVISTSDGGFLVSAWTKKPPSTEWDNMRLIKTDANGDTLWTKEMGGAGSDKVEGLIETSDGHYVMSVFVSPLGTSYHDIGLIKMTFQGEIVWEKMYPIAGDDRCFSVIQMPDGGYIIAGHSAQNGLIIRTDADGNKTWHSILENNSNDTFRDIIATADGGFACIGVQNDHFFLAKYKTDNTLEWSRKLGSSPCIGSSIVQLDDGGYFIAGFTGNWFTPNYDALVIRTDSQGNMVRQNTFGGDKRDATFFAERTPDGHVVLAGWTNSFSSNGLYDVYLLKIDIDCNLLWERQFDGGQRDEAWGLDVTDDGGFIISGNKLPGSSIVNGKVLLIRTDSQGRVTPGSSVDEKPVFPQKPTLHPNYPNPFNPKTTIAYTLPHLAHARLTIYNSAGQLVRTLVDAEQTPGTYQQTWNTINKAGGQLSSGVYVCEIVVSGSETGEGTFRATRKLLLLK